MFRNAFTVDEQIIQVNEHAFIEQAGENAIHLALEHCGSIGESHGKNFIFELAHMGIESGLSNI